MMKLVLVFVALSSASTPQKLDDFINEINSKQNLWTAGKNFGDTPLSEVRGLFGAKRLPADVLRTIPRMVHDINNTDLPESFDARTNWPECETIQQVRDQSACECSWVR